MTTAPSRVTRRPLVQTSSRQAFRAHPGSAKAQILDYLTASGGACDFETERACGLTHQNCSAERRALVKRGLVYASDEKRPAPSGVECIVWKVSPRRDSFRPGDVPPFVPPNGPREQLRFTTEVGR